MGKLALLIPGKTFTLPRSLDEEGFRIKQRSATSIFAERVLEPANSSIDEGNDDDYNITAYEIEGKLSWSADGQLQPQKSIFNTINGYDKDSEKTYSIDLDTVNGKGLWDWSNKKFADLLQKYPNLSFFDDDYLTLDSDDDGNIDVLTSQEFFNANSNQLLVNYAFRTGEITGTADDDYLKGFSGNDLIEGRDGNDYIDGGSGRNNLIGGKGRDTIEFGGNSVDIVTGGRGRDVFKWDIDDSAPFSKARKTASTLTDFKPSEGEKIHLVDSQPFNFTTQPIKGGLLLSCDTDGDGRADGFLKIMGSTKFKDSYFDSAADYLDEF